MLEDTYKPIVKDACQRCGHCFSKHRAPGSECVQVIGYDEQGFERYCECPRFRRTLSAVPRP